MGRRRYNPTTKQFDERMVVRKQEAFDYGTVSDVEPVDLPYNAVAKLVNARGHKNAIKGRTGVREWTDLRLPITKSISAVLTGSDLYCSTGCWNTDDVGSTYYADNGDILFIVEYIDSENVTVSKSKDVGDQTYATGDVTPRINAQFFDSLTKVRYFLIGTKVYARVGKDLEWLEYFILGDKPFNTISQMFKIQDKIVMVNGNGVYVLNSVYDGKYGWKSNGSLPQYKLDTESPEIDATDPSAYNYLYTYTRLNGNYNENRMSADTVTETETPPFQLQGDIKPTADYNPDVLNTDDTTMYSNFPIEETFKKTYRGNWIPSYSDYTRWVELSEDELNPSIAVTVDGISNIVYFDFSDCQSLDDVTHSLERGLRDYSASFNVRRQLTDGDQLYIFWNTDENIDWDFTEDVLDGDFNLLFHQVLVVEDNYVETMELPVGRFRYPEDRTDITHYSLYRTKDIYPSTIATPNLLDPRNGNSPDIFGWVSDIPVVESIDCSVRFVMGKWEMELASGSQNDSIIGSTFTVNGTTPVAKFTVLRRKIGETSVYDVLLTQGYQIDYIDVICTTGTDTIFMASKVGGDISTSGYTILEEDIGKPVFWEDGSVSFLTSTTTTLDTIGKDDQWVYMNPTERVYADTVSDNVRDGYLQYNSLRTRYWQSVPSSNIAAYNKGVLVLAQSDYDKVYYTETEDIVSIGYHSVNQVNDSIDKGIRCMFTVNDIFTIMSTTSTHTINPKQATVIETPYGEYYTALPDAFLINAGIGAAGQFRWTLGEKGDVMVVTSEPAVRFFNGTSFSANQADGKIQHTELQLLNENMLVSYSSTGGVHIWGFRGEEWL